MKQNEPGKPADKKGSCAFCSMLRGETESYGVFEDEVSAAFLDHRPLFPGHCLLIPKKHYETLADLPRSVVTPLFVNAQLLAAAVEQAMEAEGTFLAINNRVSQSVPHFHIHIVPRRRSDGVRGFFWPRQPYKDKETIAAVQERLRSVISRLVSDRASPPGFEPSMKGRATPA